MRHLLFASKAQAEAAGGGAVAGTGVGAAVGAIGGAAGAEDMGGPPARSYDVSDEQYERLSSSMTGSGRAVAVEESVPADAVKAAAARYGGQFV